MKKLTLLVLSGILAFAFSGTALAGSAVAQLGTKGLIRLYDDRPCELVQNENLKAAEVVWEGEKLKACWTVGGKIPEGYVFIGDETGDSGVVPISAFKEETPA